MSATQMNVRIDSSLKNAGDAVLAAYGFTASQAIRALWEYLTTQEALPPALVKMILQEQSQDVPDQNQKKDIRNEGANLLAGFYDKVGIAPHDFSEISYEELRELAAQEQREKWGW